MCFDICPSVDINLFSEASSFLRAGLEENCKLRRSFTAALILGYCHCFFFWSFCYNGLLNKAAVIFTVSLKLAHDKIFDGQNFMCHLQIRQVKMMRMTQFSSEQEDFWVERQITFLLVFLILQEIKMLMSRNLPM